MNHSMYPSTYMVRQTTLTYSGGEISVLAGRSVNILTHSGCICGNSGTLLAKGPE